MPYAVESRGDEWCVVKEADGKVMGCHASRGQAVAQQRALYASEAQTASVESPQARVEIVAQNDSVGPALVASIEAISERLITTEDTLRHVTETLVRIAETVVADRQELLAALTAAAQAPAPEAPVVHVHAAEQPAPVVHVDVPAQPAPEVNVTLEAPKQKRTVKFNRDLMGRIEDAEIEE